MERRGLSAAIHFREVGPEREAEFIARGGRRRDFFPHQLFYLPKCGPDGFKLATRMCGGGALERMWEVVLYAHPTIVGDLPRELFFDPDLIWHQQHFERVGQVATADLLERGDSLYSMAHLSDLVQRISRRRAHKTRVEERFHGWDRLLLNGILVFALERGRRTLFTPTADLALRHTDPARSPARELFVRIYDRHVQQRYRVERRGEWWALDVREQRDRLLVPERRAEPLREEKIVCVCHDVERGWGHRDVDPELARRAEGRAAAHLEEMLRLERAAGVRATYQVVGAFLPEVRAMIEAGGHAVAFHSFDHRLTRDGVLRRALALLRGRRVPEASDQVRRCRLVDYRIRGYRPARSRLTAELSATNLCRHNFEWLASSAYSLGFEQPRMRRRLVALPILLDDFALYRPGISYDAWERQALARMDRASFVAFSLHDCYGERWLPRYAHLLEAVGRRGVLKTLDQVANEVILRHAWGGPPGAGG